jgi:NAD(P)-dependent dehydrogenase (short-subunit alcohol dehydrogenase family)
MRRNARGVALSSCGLAGAPGEAQLASAAEALREAGADVLTVAADIVEPAGCAAVVRAALARHGRLDLLVASAGIGPPSPAAPTRTRLVLSRHLLGMAHSARAAAGCG